MSISNDERFTTTQFAIKFNLLPIPVFTRNKATTPATTSFEMIKVDNWKVFNQHNLTGLKLSIKSSTRHSTLARPVRSKETLFAYKLLMIEICKLVTLSSAPFLALELRMIEGDEALIEYWKTLALNHFFPFSLWLSTNFHLLILLRKSNFRTHKKNVKWKAEEKLGENGVSLSAFSFLLAVYILFMPTDRMFFLLVQYTSILHRKRLPNGFHSNNKLYIG